MVQQSKPTDSAKSVEEVQKFPLRRLYFLLIFVFTLLSPLGLFLETENIKSAPLKLSANIQINSITLLFLLLAWLPFLIPWLVTISPRFQKFFTGLREGGVEEIEAGILRIKLSPGVHEAAETYKSKVVDFNQPKPLEENPDQLERSYKEALGAIDSSEILSSAEARYKIDELAKYYNNIRATLPSSSRRTHLMVELAALLWSLMPSIKDFPVRERLNSPKGGERLSAYKYLEYKPDLDHLDLLLSRAAGILEEPFGQYAALLALRRLALNLRLDPAQKEMVIDHLSWSAQLEYMGRDRVYMMNAIISIIRKL